MKIVNPKLAELRDRVRTPKTNLQEPELEKATQSKTVFDSLREYLAEVDALSVKMSVHGEKIDVLLLGSIGDTYWWVEFCLDSDNANTLIVSLVSRPLPSNREDKPNYLELVLARQRGGHGCRSHICESIDIEDGIECSIDSILNKAFKFIEEVNDRYESATKDSSRVESYLTQLGYAVSWPPEVVYDLERVTVLTGSSERRYYVDSLENIASAAGGIYFKDILGRGIVISHGSGYIVEPLTFRNASELEAENPELVVKCCELLTGFDRQRVPGFAEPFLVYDPDWSLKIAHQFFVPVPSIAIHINPPPAVGGIELA